MIYNIVKRIFDLLLSSMALFILSPVILVIAMLIRIKLGSPIIYKQKRIGKDEKIFTIYKFRTMKEERDDKGNLLSEDMRLTRFGRFLRSTSLDEVPELFNIIKGEMSIIGPRPLLQRYLNYYTEEERIRHNIRPGLSGLAQVSGRNTTEWSERFQYDIEYVNNCNFLLDISILIRSLFLVISRKNITVGSGHLMKDLDIERGGVINYIQMTEKEVYYYQNIIREYIWDILNTNFTNQISLEDMELIFQKMLYYTRDHSAIIIGAFQKHNLLGFIWAYKREVFHEERYHVNHVVVHPEFRSFGIGSKLLDCIKEIAIENKIEKIELIVTASNDKVRSMYDKLGYKAERISLCKQLDSKDISNNPL